MGKGDRIRQQKQEENVVQPVFDRRRFIKVSSVLGASAGLSLVTSDREIIRNPLVLQNSDESSYVTLSKASDIAPLERCLSEGYPGNGYIWIPSFLFMWDHDKKGISKGLCTLLNKEGYFLSSKHVTKDMENKQCTCILYDSFSGIIDEVGILAYSPHSEIVLGRTKNYHDFRTTDMHITNNVFSEPADVYTVNLIVSDDATLKADIWDTYEKGLNRFSANVSHKVVRGVVQWFENLEDFLVFLAEEDLSFGTSGAPIFTKDNLLAGINCGEAKRINGIPLPSDVYMSPSPQEIRSFLDYYVKECNEQQVSPE
ncbi:twin-arginine translocation signal domain-containing protein [Thermoproteota archaeon]